MPTPDPVYWTESMFSAKLDDRDDVEWLNKTYTVPEDAIESLKRNVAAAIKMAAQTAADEEREACAALVTQIANYHKGFPGEAFALLDAADAIRARSNK